MKTETETLTINHAEVKEPQADTFFDAAAVIHDLKHFLPAQAPMKDFIHHNTLHAFQYLKFHTAIRHASEIFGYKVSLSLREYRDLFDKKIINDAILERVIVEAKGVDQLHDWKHKVLYTEYRNFDLPRIGLVRAGWKKHYHVDLDSLVHTTIFRIICSYLDQGISIWNFPVWHKGLLASVREIERHSFTSFFKTDRARKFLLGHKHDVTELLDILIGDPKLYKQYLFDQQFAHQGWSGLVSTVEDQPDTLLDKKPITLRDVIYLELLLEIDALDFQFGVGWQPLGSVTKERPVELFAAVRPSELSEVLTLLQEAYEWSYYDDVLAGIRVSRTKAFTQPTPLSFQAMFCIDDRECSFRRYLEQTDPHCQTYGTPGFFSVEFFFKPEHGKFYTKLCPAPVTPKYLIKEGGTRGKREKDPHFAKHSHTLFRGWIIAQTLGFWAAFKLFVNVFKPSLSPATATSFSHMNKVSSLTIENKDPDQRENGLQIGFTVPEMAQRVESLLRSIGLVKDFAPMVYAIGHGSSSVNNPHYAAYDCGACSGRPGSVNARVFCYMANHPEVRSILQTRGISIPASTQFVGGLHDTARDEVAFYDETSLTRENQENHQKHLLTFEQALKINAKERSRRFLSIDTKGPVTEIHKKVKIRTVSLFQPRPELNHANNTLCIVGRRELNRHLFLDRRAFMNSYDYTADPQGDLLFGIMKPLGPVCGGINLEYYFSRVDNQKLGAGTKLPHNVMGLFGVANGIEGDLRPGLPSQMIEVHDPIRLLIIVEQSPDVVLKTIQRQAETYEWFINEWVHLVAVDPRTNELYRFRDGKFELYQTLTKEIPVVKDIAALVESGSENLQVHLIA